MTASVERGGMSDNPVNISATRRQKAEAEMDKAFSRFCETQDIFEMWKAHEALERARQRWLKTL